MNIKDFKPGTYKNQGEYKSFSPNKVNHNWITNDTELSSMLSEADRKIGGLNEAARWMENVNIFIAMHKAKEATTSSRIEGTKTTMEEAITEAKDIDPERRDDWQEVRNYINAMNTSIGELKKLPVSNRLLKNAHRILLSGVRGKTKLPGEFRKSQVYLGSSIKNAVFIPPIHTEIEDLMADLERFLNSEINKVQPLIKIGIAHYQFETIHPFLDGNGRLGRMLITLLLCSEGLLEKPTLYLSDFFERNREEYYDRLSAARKKNDLAGWLRFFLAGVIETSENSMQTLEKIAALRRLIESKKLPLLGRRAKNGAELLKLLFTYPIVSQNFVEKKLQLSRITSFRLLDDFVNIGILRETTGFRRNRRYAFSEYLGIFSETK